MLIARNFFKYGILPEIIGKWYTRTPVTQSDGVVAIPAATTLTVEEDAGYDDSEDESRLWCYCEQPSFGQMVQCDNKRCSLMVPFRVLEN